MKILELFFLISLTFFGFGCEDVIQVDLESSASTVVIEGKVTNEDKPGEVRISKSVDYFNPGEISKVTNAKVKITTNDVVTEELIQFNQGRYLAFRTMGVPGESYKLEVELDGTTYTASSTMPRMILIDSLKVTYVQKSITFNAGYEVTVYFTDPSEIENYYKIEVYKNGDLFPDETTIRVRSDKFFNGNQVGVVLNGYQSNGLLFSKGDAVLVKLYSIDKITYEHLKTLNAITKTGFGGSSSTPANPTTNLSNGAMGYFGAFAVDERFVQI